MNVLVLGCRVYDGQPGRELVSRLERALALIDGLGAQGRHPRIVVSGRGEATVMRDWLIARGVDAARIVVELEATSTNENLENAQAQLPKTTRWLVVTSDFHVLRTRLWAWHLDVPVRVIGAVTPAKARVRNFARELIATPHSLLRVLVRRSNFMLSLLGYGT